MHRALRRPRQCGFFGTDHPSVAYSLTAYARVECKTQAVSKNSIRSVPLAQAIQFVVNIDKITESDEHSPVCQVDEVCLIVSQAMASRELSVNARAVIIIHQVVAGGCAACAR